MTVSIVVTITELNKIIGEGSTIPRLTSRAASPNFMKIGQWPTLNSVLMNPIDPVVDSFSSCAMDRKRGRREESFGRGVKVTEPLTAASWSDATSEE